MAADTPQPEAAEGTVPEHWHDNGHPEHRLPLLHVIAVALEEFVILNGLLPDRVSGIRPVESGWAILVDVVDLERIPPTTSVLSTYRVDVGREGHVLGYERIRRFTRAETNR